MLLYVLVMGKVYKNPKFTLILLRKFLNRLRKVVSQQYPEQFKIVWSRESSGVVFSHRNSSGIVWNGPELSEVIQSRPEFSETVPRCPEFSRVIRSQSHPESSLVVRTRL